MQLAIIGKISSSKSTLVNAILEKDELMSTGVKEVTYNVGWLKYGAPDSDIILHYKDGSIKKKSRKEFASLSADTSNAEIDNIRYIETFDDSEILKEINIIDTPGLDAKREKDSQNTLDFISMVRPDAVVMLFTHAVSESVLDVVRQFNTGTTLNPLNAIGILSKIDVLWQETVPRVQSALQIGRKMIDNHKRKDKTLSKTLFELYPISALLYLAATTITDNDIQDIQTAVDEAGSQFFKSLNAMPKFLEDMSFSLSIERRQDLTRKMGLYGIWLIAQEILNFRDCTLQHVKELFKNESGATEFRKSLYNHFGSRAKLIKLESVFQHIAQAINHTRARTQNEKDNHQLSAIEQKVFDIFSSMVHEHHEYEMLTRIYSGELNIDEDIVEEFRALCGEHGNSAPAMLRLPSGTPIEELLETARIRERGWRKEIALEPDPDEREWMNVILKSYSNLRNQISTMKYKYEQAKTFLLN